MSVNWNPHINELSWKYRESCEWFKFGGILWISLFWGYIEIFLSGDGVARALRIHILVRSASVNHISYTLIDEGKFNVSDSECVYGISMKNGFNKKLIVDVRNNDAFINRINAIWNYLKEQ